MATLELGRSIEVVEQAQDNLSTETNMLILEVASQTYTLYSKGEMFSTDATFFLGKIYKLICARRLDSGVYEVKIVSEDYKSVILLVNSIRAIKDIKSVNCDGEFDCSASSDFTTVINVSRK